jgi:hypothetical protein
MNVLPRSIPLWIVGVDLQVENEADLWQIFLQEMN